MVVRFLLILSLFSAVQAAEFDTQSVIYQIQFGSPYRGVELYKNLIDKDHSPPNLALIKQMGIALIERGLNSGDPESEALALFGASLSLDESLKVQIQRKLTSPIPQIQLSAMRFLAQMDLSENEPLFRSLLASPNPIIRIETLFVMAERGFASTSSQAEALLHKLPQEAAVLFPPLLVKINDRTSQRLLKKFLTHATEEVRLQTLLVLTEAHRDEYLSQVRRMLSHTKPQLQEASAFYLGEMHDKEAIPQLEHLLNSDHAHVRISAARALVQMGSSLGRATLGEEAKSGNLFAIHALDCDPIFIPLLEDLSKSSSKDIVLNASWALLKLKSPKGVSGIEEILVPTHKMTPPKVKLSPAHSQQALLFGPWPKNEQEEAQFHRIKKELFALVVDLPEDTLFPLIQKIYLSHHLELVPLATQALESIGSPQAINILKAHNNQLGAPVIRQFTACALCKLGETGPYLKQVKDWLEKQRHVPLLHVTPPSTKSFSYAGDTPSMATETELLILTIETLLQQKDKETINLLLDTIIYGHPKNAFALAGLLIRAAI